MRHAATGLLLSTVILMTAITGVEAGNGYARWAGNGLLIRGFDTTAYFKHRRPVPGASGHTVSYNGAKWHFQTAEQAALFQSNPAAYSPQFGAYCTGGLSQQHVVDGHPLNWRMHNGKLYLFFSAVGARRFDADPEGVIRRARAYAKTVGIKEN